MIVPITIQSGAPSTSAMTRYRTFICYGDPRTGKTRFAGTAPNALFISEASERGWITLETMPAEAFYHPGQAPVVLPVADHGSMIQALHIAEGWIRNGWIDTIVFDSLTFYADAWFAHEMTKMKAVSGVKTDTRALYGALANHLSELRQIVHGWPCNVIWLALAASPDDDNLGGPMLAGKSRARFPAGCDHIFHHRRYDALDADKQMIPVFEVRTMGHDRFVGGGRDGGMLPDPLAWPTFRLVGDYLQLAEFPSKRVPPEAIAAVLAANLPPPAAVTVKAAAPVRVTSATPPVKPPVRRG